MTNIEQAIECSARATSYGVHETNPLWMTGVAHADVRHDLGVFNLGGRDENGRFYVKELVRLRLLTDRDFPWWEVSYCYGRLQTGELVRVYLGVDHIKKAYGKVSKAHLIEIAKMNGRYAKQVGLLAPDGGYGDALSELR